MPSPKQPKNVVEVDSAEALAKATANASGPVVLDFYSEECPPCQEEAPRIAEIAEKHPDLTVIKVEVEKAPDLADAWGVEQMPTLYFAKKGEGLTKSKAKELQDSSELREALGG